VALTPNVILTQFPGGNRKTFKKKGIVMIQVYYQVTLDSFGQPYLDAEEQLIAQGPAATLFLQEQIGKTQGLPRLITQVILELIAGNGDFKAALAYLVQAEQRAAATALLSPPPEAVAEYLVRHFGDRVGMLFGVYLLKLHPIWPDWKTLAATLYLGRVSGTISADPLIAFISATTNNHHRTIAVQSLVAVGDAAVLQKVEAELKSSDIPRSALNQAADQIREKLEAHA